jgi:UV DNA damage endonuclease
MDRRHENPKKGVCCIVLTLEEQDPALKFKTITYKSFESLPREEALQKLGDIISHNLKVTQEAIRYCGNNHLNYRLSSSIFPLLTYDKAEVSLEDLPNAAQIDNEIELLRDTVKVSGVRLSTHPDQFNVLASDNEETVLRTIRELDFYGKFMTRIGCPLSHESPINLHMGSAQNQDWWNISDKFNSSFLKLSNDVRSRLVLENDDKPRCWSVKKLLMYLHLPLNIPITFDYLHHACHPDKLSEKEAFDIAYHTWGRVKPLFHYSEAAPGQNNPRKHADYSTAEPDTYGKAVDLDYEFKMKEKSWSLKK